MRRLLLPAMLLCANAFALDPQTAGQRLAATCANCHGTNGVSAGGGMGSLAGIPKDKMLAAFQGFKAAGSKATVMHQLAKGYADDEIALMAAYFAAQPAPVAPKGK